MKDRVIDELLKLLCWFLTGLFVCGFAACMGSYESRTGHEWGGSPAFVFMAIFGFGIWCLRYFRKFDPERYRERANLLRDIAGILIFVLWGSFWVTLSDDCDRFGCESRGWGIWQAMIVNLIFFIFGTAVYGLWLKIQRKRLKTAT